MAQSSSASASAAPDSDYDVFINHRGLDVKKTFASLLYRRLTSHGLRVFLDQRELRRGEYLIPQIEAAIRSASVHVAIFSEGYAESTWCLRELVLMLESNFPVIPVFYKVKPEELRWTRGKEKGYAKALEGLEKKTTADPDTGEKKLRYEASLIKKWRNAFSQAAEISGFELEACNSDEGELLDNVVEGVLKKVKKPAKYPTVLTGAAANTISPNQLIDDVIHLDRNTQLLDIAELNRMKTLLLHIANQRSPPDTVDIWLERLHNSLDDAKCVVDRAQPQKRWLQCFLCRPTLSTQVREWNANFHRLFVDFEREFSVLGNTERTVSSAPLLQPVPQALLQPVPQSGFVGKRIKDDQDRLHRWLENEDHQFRIIGVYGMGGIGKTSLLKTLFNAYKKGNLFEAVIWTVVSQICSISGLQADIAKQINLDLGSSSSVELTKMELSACLREKKFLLILDDLWRVLQLDEVLEMRHLILAFDAQDYDVLEDLPRDMRSMKKLQRLWLENYHGRSLPNCIAEFPQLERLGLWRCFQLRDLPPLERLPNLRSLLLKHCTNLKELGIGAWGSVRGFPMLESLTLQDLPLLESLGSSSSDIVWNEQTLPKLQVLTIKDCPSLNGLPRGIGKLPDLETIKVQQNWWEKNDGEIFLKEKLHHSIVFIE